MDIASEGLWRHVSGCEKLGLAAAESRSRMEDALRVVMIKLEGLTNAQDQRTGALKFSAWLWRLICGGAALFGWCISHFQVIK